MPDQIGRSISNKHGSGHHGNNHNNSNHGNINNGYTNTNINNGNSSNGSSHVNGNNNHNQSNTVNRSNHHHNNTSIKSNKLINESITKSSSLLSYYNPAVKPFQRKPFIVPIIPRIHDMIPSESSHQIIQQPSMNMKSTIQRHHTNTQITVTQPSTTSSNIVNTTSSTSLQLKNNFFKNHSTTQLSRLPTSSFVSKNANISIKNGLVNQSLNSSFFDKKRKAPSTNTNNTLSHHTNTPHNSLTIESNDRVTSKPFTVNIVHDFDIYNDNIKSPPKTTIKTLPIESFVDSFISEENDNTYLSNVKSTNNSSTTNSSHLSSTRTTSESARSSLLSSSSSSLSSSQFSPPLSASSQLSQLSQSSITTASFSSFAYAYDDNFSPPINPLKRTLIQR